MKDYSSSHNKFLDCDDQYQKIVLGTFILKGLGSFWSIATSRSITGRWKVITFLTHLRGPQKHILKSCGWELRCSHGSVFERVFLHHLNLMALAIAPGGSPELGLSGHVWEQNSGCRNSQCRGASPTPSNQITCKQYQDYYGRYIYHNWKSKN